MSSTNTEVLRSSSSKSQEVRKKAVKDHVQSTLALKRGVRKAIDDNFVCHPLFRNHLPEAPIGPFFRTFELQNSPEDFSKFYVSSLEKSYTFRPHFDTDLGINLDLVDQETFLVPEKYSTEKPHLHPADARFVLNQTKSLRPLPFTQENKPWWLRNTIYLENDLYKSKTRGGASKVEVKETANDDLHLDPYSEEFIVNSFELIKKLPIDPSRKKKQVLWSIPLLPSDINDRRKISMVQFSEAIDYLFENERKRGGEGDPLEDEKPAAKRSRRTILTNSRELPATHEHAGATAISLLALKQAEAEEGNNKDEEETEHYDWVRDYRLEVDGGSNSGAVFMLSVDAADQKQCSYSHLNLRKMNMHKLLLEDGAPCEARVLRRMLELEPRDG